MKTFLKKLLTKLSPKPQEDNFITLLQKEIDKIYDKHMEEAEKEERLLVEKLKKTIEMHMLKTSEKQYDGTKITS